MNAYQLLAQVTDVKSFWSGFDGEQRFVLCILGIVFGTIAVLVLSGIVAGTLKGIKERQIEADLKRDMLDRGMTADEIERIVKARASQVEDTL